MGVEGGSVECTSELHWRQNAVAERATKVHWYVECALKCEGCSNVNQCNAIIKHISSSSLCPIHMRNALDNASTASPSPLLSTPFVATPPSCNPFYFGVEE